MESKSIKLSFSYPLVIEREKRANEKRKKIIGTALTILTTVLSIVGVDLLGIISILPKKPSPIGPQPICGERIVVFGSRDWLVIDEKDGMELLIAKNVMPLRDIGLTDKDLQKVTSWEESPLRKYLITTFFEEEFSNDERSRIQATWLDTHDSTLGLPGGRRVQDTIFLLSIEDVSGKEEELGQGSSGVEVAKVRVKTTGYLKCTTRKRDGKIETACGMYLNPWFLRDPGMVVYQDGKIGSAAHLREDGYYYISELFFPQTDDYGMPVSTIIGILPALWRTKSDYLYT